MTGFILFGIPVLAFIYSMFGKHGTTVMLVIGSAMTAMAAASGDIFAAIVDAMITLAYLYYAAEKYNRNRQSYKAFKDYIDTDYSDVEEWFRNIFGEGQSINRERNYEREFNEFFTSRGQEGTYSYSKTYQKNNYSNSANYSTNKGSESARANRFTQKDYSQTSANTGEYINQTAASYGLRYYVHCKDVDEAKKLYRKYAVTFHPDNPRTGDEKKFVEIDTQYNKFVELFGKN